MKANQARIQKARHEAIRNRLISDGLLPNQADRWISAWAETAGEPESPAEFDAAYEWIVSELAGGRRIPDAAAAAVTTRAARGAGTS